MPVSPAGPWGGGRPSPQHGISYKKQMLHSWGSRFLPNLGHFSQAMSLAKSTSPSLGQERHQQTQPDGSELEFLGDSFHSFLASLGHDSTS